MKKIIPYFVLFATLFTASFILRPYGFPVFASWLILAILLFFSVALGLKEKNEKKLFLALIILEISLTLMVILSFPGAIHLGSDELFESGFSNTIITGKKIDPSLGSGFAKNYYGYTPVLHIPLSFLSIMTGISTFDLSRSLYVLLLRLTFISIAYLFIRKLVNSDFRLAYFSILMFIPSSRLIIMFITRRITGAIFVLFTLYCLISLADNKKSNFRILSYIFGACLIFSDRTQALIFAALIFGFIFYTAAVKKEINYDLLAFGIIFLIGLISWYIFFAVPVLITDLGYISGFYKYLSSHFRITDVAGSIASSGFHMYELYERIIAYFSQFLFIVIAFLGLIVYISLMSNKKRPFLMIRDAFFDKKNAFFNYMCSLSFIFYSLMIVLILTPWFYISGTYLWLISIPLCILLALFIIHISDKKLFLLAYLIILVIFVGGLFSKYPPILLNRMPGDGNILELSESRTKELLESGDWLRMQAERDSIIIGDRTVFDIYSGVHGLNVIGGENAYAKKFLTLDNTTQFEDLLMADDFKYKHAQETIEGNIDYIVINEKLFAYPSLLLDGNSLENDQKEVIDSVFYLNKIYDDSEIDIYYNEYNQK